MCPSSQLAEQLDPAIYGDKPAVITTGMILQNEPIPTPFTPGLDLGVTRIHQQRQTVKRLKAVPYRR